MKKHILAGLALVAALFAGGTGAQAQVTGACPAGQWVSVVGSNIVSQACSAVSTFTGILPVANGGTGLASLTSHDLIIGNGVSAATLLAPSSTSGVPLISQGASSNPAYGTAVVAGGGTGAVTLGAHGVLVGEGTSPVTAITAMTDGQLLVGASSADPTAQTLSKDCTLAANGAITCTKTNNVALTSAATTAIGTSGATIPLLSTANTWTLAQTPTGGIAAAGGFTASCRLSHTGGVPALSATSSYTAQTPVTTEFYVAEVFIPANCSATGVALFNSATISGNVKVGLANSAGANVATSVSTAMSGTTTYQLVPFNGGAYAAVGPATYYIEVFYDNNTVRPNTFTSGSFGTGKATSQTYATGFTTQTMPTTFATALGPVASLY